MRSGRASARKRRRRRPGASSPVDRSSSPSPNGTRTRPSTTPAKSSKSASRRKATSSVSGMRSSLRAAIILLLLGLLAVSACGASGSATTGTTGAAKTRSPARVGLKKIGDFDNPAYVAAAPGSPRLLFVVEQPGRVEVLRGGHRLRHPFLDISGLVSFEGERGLLSIAFPPDYAKTGRFYAYYTNNQGN